MDNKDKAPDRVGSEADAVERWLHIIPQLLRVLEKEGCTAKEALQILDNTKEVVLLTAPVNSNWPCCD